jgi:hypothetical protein
MAIPVSPSAGVPLIAGQFLVDGNRPLAPVGGLPCFGAVNQHSGLTDLIAVQVQRRFPPRGRALQILSVPIDGLLTPLAHGAVPVPGPADAYYVICPAPPGPSLLANLRVWPEGEILERVLRPIALILEQLQARGVTHRGIRLDNLFQIHAGEAVTLGMAWAAPPALAQPALFEPPYSAMCLPVGRGDGSAADDVYALGVVLLCLALGRVPLAQLDEGAILRRKLELGSFAALAGDERLPPIVADLVRGMLAEDPEHRPPPMLLLDPASARGRRVAARPPPRAQRSLVLGDSEIWNARSLAHAMAIEPDQALHALRAGAIVPWLRRGLGDGVLATRVEELLRHRLMDMSQDEGGDPMLVMRAITVLDPLAPLCWRGLALWPDGVGPALAAAQGTDADVIIRLEELVGLEVVTAWAAMRPERCDAAMLRVEARQQHGWLQSRGKQDATGRLTYLMNPLLPCGSALMQGRWVVRLPDLLPALEAASGKVDRAQTAPLDVHLATFIAAHSERRLDSELNALAGAVSDEAACMAQWRLLAQLQTRHYPAPVPGLTSWLAQRAEPLLATWRNRERRRTLKDRQQLLGQAGQIVPMLALMEDQAERSVDTQEAQLAAEELAWIDDQLAQISTGAVGRAAMAHRLGQEFAAGIGLAALAAVLVIAALG